MKLNLSYPATGCQKLIEVDDEKKVRFFYDKRISTELPMDSLGDEWKGYIVRISGGNDKQGFPMMQGVLTTSRVRLLLSKKHSCYRPRRDGERKRKSVRGCIVDSNLSVLNLVIVKKGEQEIPGLTDKTIPRRLGPKRASRIRKLFNLSKEDDVRQYVVRRPIPATKEGRKPRSVAPKIQRLVTPLVLQRKRHRIALKRRRAVKRREEAAEYAKLLAQRMKEAKERKMERRRSASHSKSRDSLRESTGAAAKVDVKTATKSASKAGKAAKGKAQKPAAKGAAKAASKPAAPKAAAAKAKQGAKPSGKQAAKPAAAKAAKPPQAKAKPSAAKAQKPKAKAKK